MEIKKQKKKIILFTILFTILIEFFLCLALGVIIYFNYDKLSSANSGISDNIIEKEFKNLSLDIDLPTKLDNNDFYNGNFGKVDIKEETINNKKVYSTEKTSNFEINLEEINKHIIIETLFKNNLLDKYLYSSIIKSDDVNKELNNILTLESLLGFIKKDFGEKILNEINEKQRKVQIDLISLIKTNSYKKISDYLFFLENNFKSDLFLLSDNLFSSNTILNDENFKYVISVLYSDEYYKNIKEISINTGVDEKLIIASIGVEQLRFLTTDRAYAKSLLKQNKFLTNFNKFSYGIGGIKFNTFKKINSELQEYDIDMYNKYFKDYDLSAISKTVDGVNIYSDTKIQEILENEYTGILYVAGLIYNIQKKWELAGFPIDNRPGIIITLYNMGNEKNPHANPDVGGSKIFVNENISYYFGEIGYIMYYYMKYYL